MDTRECVYVNAPSLPHRVVPSDSGADPSYSSAKLSYSSAGIFFAGGIRWEISWRSYSLALQACIQARQPWSHYKSIFWGRSTSICSCHVSILGSTSILGLTLTSLYLSCISVPLGVTPKTAAFLNTHADTWIILVYYIIKRDALARYRSETLCYVTYSL